MNFQRHISLTPEEHVDALGKAERIGRSLHNAYYPGDFDPSKVLLVGSYGKGTAIRPTSDVDLMYFLPPSEYTRYSGYNDNGQSALLQDIRAVLLETFPRTAIKADGQVVVVDYATFKFEVVPAFLIGQQVMIPDTNNGGRWKPAEPVREYRQLNETDVMSLGHVRALVKYAKVWKRAQDVPLKSIILERAAIVFVESWPYLHDSISYPTGCPAWWHDWLIRDFFEFLLRFENLSMPHGEIIPFGDGWRRKTEAALHEATQASYHEQHDQHLMAESHWRNIFGAQFPGLPRALPQDATRRILLGA